MTCQLRTACNMLPCAPLHFTLLPHRFALVMCIELFMAPLEGHS